MRLIALASFLVFASANLSTANAECSSVNIQAQHWDGGSLKISDGPSIWTYKVDVSSWKWRQSSIPRHNSVSPHCIGCGFYNYIGGTYALHAKQSLQEGKDVSFAASSKQRIAQQYQFRRYPWGLELLGKRHLELISSRDDLTIGPLTGYAVLYRFTDIAFEEISRLGTNHWLSKMLPTPFTPQGLLIVTAMDECAVFDIDLTVPIDEAENWRVLDSFLENVSIQKVESPGLR